MNMRVVLLGICLTGLVHFRSAGKTPDRLADPVYLVNFTVEPPENYTISQEDIEILKVKLLAPYNIAVSPISMATVKIRIDTPSVSVISKLAANLVRLELRAELLLLKQDDRGMTQVLRVPLEAKAVEEGAQNAFQAALKSIKHKKEDMERLREYLVEYSLNEEI